MSIAKAGDAKGIRTWVRQRPGEAILVIIALALLARMAWVYRRAVLPIETPTAAAERVLKNVLDGNMNQLTGDVMPSEWDVAGLDGDRFRELANWVSSSLERYKADDLPLIEGTDKIGTASQPLVDSKGNRAYLNIRVYQTQTGPKLFLFPIVLSAINAKYIGKYPDDDEELAIWKGRRDGLKAELPQLSSFAPKDLCQTDPDRILLYSWKEWLARVEKSVEYLENAQREQRKSAERAGR